jgi:hypothetical protein
MVTRKTPVFTPLLISMTCVGFGAGFYLRHSQAEQDARVLARSLSEVQEKLSRAEADRAALEKSREEALSTLQSERDRLETETAEAKVPVPVAGAGGSNPAKAPVSVLSEMMKDPSMRDAMKGQQVAMLDMHYGKLFNRFQLSEAEKQDFKNLLTERMQKEFDFGAVLMSGGKDPQQIASLSSENKEALRQIDEKIKTFLNHENDFQTFKRWEETKNDRLQLEMSTGAFAAAGEALSPEQEDRLVDAMHRSRMSAVGVPDLNKPENFLPQNFTPEMLDKVLKNYDERSSVVLQQAAEFLSPKQVETLQSVQGNQRKMQELGFKMLSGGILGGKK